MTGRAKESDRVTNLLSSFFAFSAYININILTVLFQSFEFLEVELQMSRCHIPAVGPAAKSLSNWQNTGRVRHILPIYYTRDKTVNSHHTQKGFRIHKQLRSIFDRSFTMMHPSHLSKP
jgi:hypothetical protein